MEWVLNSLRKIFLNNPHLVALRSNQLKVKMKEDGETRIAMDSTFYLGSKSASARDDWSAVDIRVSTLERAQRASVFSYCQERVN